MYCKDQSKRKSQTVLLCMFSAEIRWLSCVFVVVVGSAIVPVISDYFELASVHLHKRLHG